MKKYNYDKIDKLLQPLMEMMREEYPNEYKLIVEPDFCRIIHESDVMIFQSDEIKKTNIEVKPNDTIHDFLNLMYDLNQIKEQKEDIKKDE